MYERIFVHLCKKRKEKKRKLMHPSNINIRNSLFASTFETNLDGGIRYNYDEH